MNETGPTNGTSPNGDVAGPKDAAQSAGASKYALLAIVLPFIGVIAGALIEHGTDGICRLRIVHCDNPRTQIDDLRGEIEHLQQSLATSQAAVTGLQARVGESLKIVDRCQSSLLDAANATAAAEKSVPPQVTVECPGGAFQAPTQRVVNLGPANASLQNLTGQLRNQADEIVGEVQRLSSPL